MDRSRRGKTTNPDNSSSPSLLHHLVIKGAPEEVQQAVMASRRDHVPGQKLWTEMCIYMCICISERMNTQLRSNLKTVNKYLTVY